MKTEIEVVKESIIEFQIKRFQEKYKNLFQKDEEYLSAKIIFEKIYIGQSNKNIIQIALKVYKKFKFLINKRLRKHIESLIFLQDLTDDLDLKMSEKLLSHGWKNEPIQIEIYENLFVQVSTKKVREKQLFLFLENLKFIYSLTQNQKVLFYLKKINKLFGNISFFQSLEHSYEEMLKIRKNVFEKFCKVLQEEETKYLNRLFK